MSNADWFARKLGNQPPAPAQYPVTTPMTPPSQRPMAPMPTFQQPQAPVTKAQSAANTATCPECWSGNYMAVPGYAPRCYDCGYPIQQRGSGMSGTSNVRVEGAAKPALGNNTQSNVSLMPPGYGPDGQKLF